MVFSLLMKKIIKNIINKLPYIKGLFAQVQNLKKNACFPPGHFYSSIVSVEDIKKRASTIWKDIAKDSINSIDLNTEEQKALVQKLSQYYNELPFKRENVEGMRYKFNNGLYSFTDGIILYTMMRYLRPKKIIEVGSGHSSALMLDVNQHFFENNIDLMFIEPFPERLYKMISEKDKKGTTILEEKIQDVDLSYFKHLQKGDILFIDSTHVSKCGSDVNHILFDILPVLNAGVYIHFHDIFYPFEYPKEWIYKGMNWNEDYILRAFLMHNNDYKIKVFSHYLHTHHASVFKNMPLAYENKGGNLWLEKVN